MAHDLTAVLPAVLEVLSHLNLAVMVVADQGRGFEQWYANEASAQLFGYPLDELRAMDPIDNVWPDDQPLVRSLSSSFRAGQQIPAAIEFAGITKAGERIPFEVTLAGVPIEDGFAYVLVLRVVEPTLSSQLSLLEADRIGLVGALAAGVAHEINNPLTSVLLNLRSLRKQLVTYMPGSEQAAALRCHADLTTASERIASNVRALQTLATRSAPGAVDMAALVSASLRLAQPTLGPRAQVIRQIFPVPSIHGEEARLGQAVLAMLLFACSGFDSDEVAEKSASPRRIVVEVAVRGDHVIVEVTDNGGELSAEDARRAFEPFLRAPLRGAGVGVGLGVAQSVALTHGGEVVLAPCVGGGAVITMTLPIAHVYDKPEPV